MSKKTGRPKEQGGHHRINISIDKPSRDVLQKTKNKSRFIEQSISTCTHWKRIRFHEPTETTNSNQYEFKNAMTFDWTPDDTSNNAILSIICYFQYRSTCEEFRFKLLINEETSCSFIGGSNSPNYTWSQVFKIREFGLDGIKTSPNQDIYNITFQFKPQYSSCTASVKDINIFLEVVDGMPAV